MLKIIHQNGSQKFEVGTYFINKQEVKESEDAKEAKTVYNIIIHLSGLDNPFWTVAQYDTLESACVVFNQMVKLERNNGIAILPPDNAEAIAAFRSSDTGWSLLK